jgi:HlyD family secretion protein
VKASKGPFLVTISVQGSVDSLKNAQLVNKVENTTTIISIKAEGEWVRQGEVVVELDSAALVDRAKTQEIQVTNAEAAESASAAQVQITETQNQSLIAAAQLALNLARLDFRKYTDGEYPQQLEKLSGALNLAKEQLARAKENYEFTKTLSRKGYRTQNEVEAERISVVQYTNSVKAAEQELRVLTDYLKQRNEAELEAKATELEREVERVKLQCTAASDKAQKQWEADKQKLEAEREILRKWQEQIEACKMRAPQDGQVVYANLGDSSRRSDGSGNIELGAQVRERQAIVNLPDITQMKVDCRIHESMIGNIREGATARIIVSARKDDVFNGRVTSVSNVAMQGRFPNYDLREYKTEITLTDNVEKISQLRPGLTAIVEILVDSRNDVLQIPIQSVYTVGTKNYVWVMTRSGPERREVKVGLNNMSHWEVLDGVAEGEQVVQNPRGGFPAEITQLEAENEAKKASSTVDAAAEAPPVAPAAPGTGDGAAGNGQRPAGGGQGGQRQRLSPDEIISTNDKDSDGKLSEAEAPEQMKANFSTIDANSDGFVTREELAARTGARGPGGGGGGGGGGPGGGGGGGGPGGGGGGDRGGGGGQRPESPAPAPAAP